MAQHLIFQEKYFSWYETVMTPISVMIHEITNLDG